MDMDPIDPKVLSRLVQVKSVGDQLRVQTREGVHKEFKESFTWGSIGLYARTMAAFANARGGYIIFGVMDKPRIAVGLGKSGLDKFDDLDRAKLTEGLNQLFSPEIDWEATVYQLPERKSVSLGIIYTYESLSKPIIARKSHQQQNGNLVEGDILYRYNSRTERAKYPEVRRILDDARSRENRAMMGHIEELIRAGASNAAVLDFNSGTLQGSSGQKVLVDEDLLAKVSFIREGEFSEVQGAPTLRLVGDIQPTRSVRIASGRVVHRALTTEDVIIDFLDQSPAADPLEYLRQAASGSTSFVPVHFYRATAGLTGDQLIDFVAGIHTRSPAKAKLLSRLESDESMKVAAPSMSTQHESTIARRTYYEELTKSHVSENISSAEDARCFAGAVLALSDEEILALTDSLLDVLKMCIGEFYEYSSPVADAIRRAACRVDYAMYGSQ